MIDIQECYIIMYLQDVQLMLQHNAITKFKTLNVSINVIPWSWMDNAESNVTTNFLQKQNNFLF